MAYTIKPYSSAGTAGTFVAPGNSITLLESDLLHLDSGDALVNKGQACSAFSGEIVGVANESAAAATDYLSVSTKGIWDLSVKGENTAGDAAIVRGDKVFIDSDGEVNSDDSGIYLGIALFAVASAATTVTPVLLRGSMPGNGTALRGLADVEEALTAAAPAADVIGVSTIDSTLAAVDATLAAGIAIGQLKMFVMTEASNSSTVTLAAHETSDPEVATFDAIDEYGLFIWTGTEWATVVATCTFV
ncbi:MAG: DUF2190 family protein [Gammaproteobacteria bacterium]